MSQKIVYQILEELGGKATFSDIKNKAKEKYPNYTLYTYVGQRLRGLKNWGYIEYIKDKKQKEGIYVIREPFPA